MAVEVQGQGRATVQQLQRRSEMRTRNTRARWVNPHDEVGLAVIMAVGVIFGLLAMYVRQHYLPSDYEADSRKIESIANGSRPDFVDSSFTPIANIYEFLGLANQPAIASLLGYGLAIVVIYVAVYWHGRKTATWITAAYAIGAFIFAGVYLGQYSKDVFLLPVVLLAIVLPRRIYWDLILLLGMGGAAYLFRDYWALIAAAYVTLRLLTLAQVRIRYLLTTAMVGAAALGLAIYFLRGHAPNYYRTSVQGNLEAATFIHPLEPLPQPLGGVVDIIAQFWLFMLPVTLPLVAGAAYIVVMLALSFLRVAPLIALRSDKSWPPASSLNGATLRRSLALFQRCLNPIMAPYYATCRRCFHLGWS